MSNNNDLALRSFDEICTALHVLKNADYYQEYLYHDWDIYGDMATYHMFKLQLGVVEDNSKVIAMADIIGLKDLDLEDDEIRHEIDIQISTLCWVLGKAWDFEWWGTFDENKGYFIDVFECPLPE
jgi:hypothetical protein